MAISRDVVKMVSRTATAIGCGSIGAAGALAGMAACKSVIGKIAIYTCSSLAASVMGIIVADKTEEIVDELYDYYEDGFLVASPSKFMQKGWNDSAEDSGS